MILSINFSIVRPLVFPHKNDNIVHVKQKNGLASCSSSYKGKLHELQI